MLDPQALQRLDALVADRKAKGQWNEQLEAAYKQAQWRVQTQTIFTEAGMPEADQTRLLTTGVTPGTAAEFANAHIAYLRKRGIDVPEGRQTAIFDLYKSQSGRTDTTNQDFGQQQRQRELDVRGESLGGRVQNYAGGINQNLANTGLSILGLAAPQTANQLAQATDTQHATTTGSYAAGAGQLTAEAAKLLALQGAAGMASTPVGAMATFAAPYAAQGAGDMRRLAATQRAQGQEVSGLQEAGAAIAGGGTEAVMSLVSQKLFQVMGTTLKAIPGLSQAVASGEPRAIQSFLKTSVKQIGGMFAEGTEEAVTQLISNKIKQGINPDQALTEGVQESFMQGMILAPIGALGHRSPQAGGASVERTVPPPPPAAGTGSTQPPAATQPRPTLPTSTPQAVPPVNPLEQRLTGQEATRPPQNQLESRLIGQNRMTPQMTQQDIESRRGTEDLIAQAQAEIRRSDELLQRVRPPQPTTPVSRQSDVRTDATTAETFKTEVPKATEGFNTAQTILKDLPGAATGRWTADEVVKYVGTMEPTAADAVRPIIGDGPFVVANVPVKDLTLAHVGVEGEVNAGKLEDAKDFLAAGSPAPPIVAGLLGRGLMVADGSHRLLAAREAGAETIAAVIPESVATARGWANTATPATPATPVEAAPAVVETPAVPLPSQPKSEVNRRVQAIADEYAADRDLAPPPEPVKAVSGLKARRIATHYDSLKHDPNNPEVKASYDAFKSETLDQFNDLKQKGYQFEAWDKPGQPYQSVEEMARDIADNHHLYFSADPGDMPSDHPMREVAPGTGGLLHNDVFRAVHDVMGHAADGAGFDMTGEENAWRQHSRLYSELARGALTTETRGQASWVGYGPQGKQNAQALADGQPGALRFPPQKAGLLPREFWTDAGLPPVAPSQSVKPPAPPAPPTPPQGDSPTLPPTQPPASPAPEGPDGRHKRLLPRAVESGITPIDARIRDISPTLYGRLNEMEFNVNSGQERLIRQASGTATSIIESLGGKGSRRYTDFQIAVRNGDREAATAMLPQHLQEPFQEFYDIRRNLLDAQREAGVQIGDLGPDSWPSKIKNYRKYREAMGLEEQGAYDRLLDDREKQLGRPLTTEEEIELLNGFTGGYGPTPPGRTGHPFARKRKVEAVDRDTIVHYADPFDAFFDYVRTATKAAEKARFLGKNPQNPEDVATSVGKLVSDEVAAGRLSPDDQREVHDLLQSRFRADLSNMHPLLRMAKQGIFLTSLTRIGSALNQLGDVALTAATHGVGPAAQGVAAALRNQFKLTPKQWSMVMEDIGLHSYGQDFHDTGRLQQATNFALRLNLFSNFDRFGKETRQNAALLAMEKAAQNPDSRAFRRLKAKYEPVLGTERFAKVVDDLKNRRKTLGVNFLNWLDITEVQPASMSQVPKAYLDNPNGRIVYTLKLFTLSQLNWIRRNTFRLLRNKETVPQGLENLGALLAFAGLTQMGIQALKDLISGKPLDPDQVPTRAAEAILRLFNTSPYDLEAVTSNPVEAFFKQITPPHGIVKDTLTDARTIAKGEVGEKGFATVRATPLIGDIVHGQTQIGAGYHKTRREEPARLKAQAVRALEAGEDGVAKETLTEYNALRREAYQTRLEQWRQADPATRGGRPSFDPLTLSQLRRQVRQQEAR